jgi:hypothetical protein
LEQNVVRSQLARIVAVEDLAAKMPGDLAREQKSRRLNAHLLSIGAMKIGPRKITGEARRTLWVTRDFGVVSQMSGEQQLAEIGVRPRKRYLPQRTAIFDPMSGDEIAYRWATPEELDGADWIDMSISEAKRRGVFSFMVGEPDPERPDDVLCDDAPK